MVKIQYINLKNNLKVIKGNTFLIVEDDQLEVQSYLKEQQKSTWQAQKRELQETIKNIWSDLNRLHFKQKNYVITDSISDGIVNYLGLQKRSFININQTIAEIALYDNLIVECCLSPHDSRFNQKQEQQVNLQIDPSDKLIGRMEQN